MTKTNSRKKIKILVVIDFIYGVTGGTENQVVKIVNNLNREKYKVTLVVLKNTPWLMNESSILSCQLELLNYDVFNHGDFRNIVEFIKLLRIIQNIRPDIVITFFSTSYILGVLAAKIAGVKKIISTRRDYGLWLNRWNVFLLRFVNQFAQGIITNSKEVKDLVVNKEKFACTKIAVIYNGIEFNEISLNSFQENDLRKKLKIGAQDRVVGLVAGLRPMKRHYTFIKAAKSIVDINNHVIFVLVGDGPLRNELENMVNQYQLSEHFRFVGWQTPVWPYLRLFDVGINCSANEGLSNAIMEYMIQGIPTIASKAGGNSELIQDGVNGFLFELDNYWELSEKILKLLTDKQLQQKFIRKSQEIIIENFSIKMMITNYESYFEKMLVQHRN